MSVIASRATVTVHPRGVRVDIPLAGETGPRPAIRRIEVHNAAIGAFLGGGETVERMTDDQRGNAVRNNLARVIRRAGEKVALQVPNLPILPMDAPRGRGLPDLISLKEGEM